MHRWLRIAGLVLAAAASTAAAQDTSASPTQATTPAPRKPAKKPANTDPVPDAPAPAPDAAPAPSAATPADQLATTPDATAPDAAPPATPGKKRSTAEANPFPEDFSKAAAKEGGDAAPPDPDQTNPDQNNAPSPDSNSPGAPESSSQQGLDKVDLYGDKDKKHRKDADPDAGLPFDPKRAVQDNKIGELYLKNGNAPGAYSRFKEATQYDAGNADAVFGLAEAAKQMNLTDEAAQSYQTYLFAFPEGPKARLAKKALAELKLKEKH
jgi:Tetratricopeptide repeat